MKSLSALGLLALVALTLACKCLATDNGADPSVLKTFPHGGKAGASVPPAETSSGRADGAVRLLWDRYRTWNGVAEKQSRDLVRTRMSVLYLSVAGAALQTLSTQIPPPAKSLASLAGGGCLSLVPFITSRCLNKDRVQRGKRSQVTAEAIKAEIFMFRSSVAPYNQQKAVDTVDLLINKVEAITSDVKDLFFLSSSQELGTDQVGPPGPLDRPSYVQKRVTEEVHGHRRHARRLAKRAKYFEHIQSSFTTAAAAAGFLAGSTSIASAGAKGAMLSRLAPWGAVATTAAGAVATHLHMAKLSERSSQNSATAKRLENLALRLDGDVAPGSQEWTNFVRNCEEAIAAENPKWNAVKDEED
mmetsp:Transcript_26263/g.77662  ORF Transcript_26263/g.77662 Transcript_26263/m.77662 type:complete len:359 (-) Transcript_26263:197-1273(-)